MRLEDERPANTAAPRGPGGAGQSRFDQHLPSVLQRAGLFVWFWDVASNSMYEVSEPAGLPKAPGSLGRATLESWLEKIHPDDAGIAADFFDALRGGAREPLESEVRFSPDGGAQRRRTMRGQVVEWTTDGTAALAAVTLACLQGGGIAELRDIADDAPGALFRFSMGPDGSERFDFISKGISIIDGLDDRNVMADASEMWRRLNAEDLAALRDAVAASAANLSRLVAEFRMTGGDGVTRWIRLTAIPRREAGGSVVWNGMASDISAIKEIEEKLRDNEYRFRTLLEGSFNGLCIHENGTIMVANPGLARITGYELEELLGRDVLSLVTPESRPAVLQKIQARTPAAYEVVGVRKDGTPFPMEVHSKEIPYRGRSVRVVELRDLTEMRVADEALRDSEARFRLLVEHAPEAIVVVDSETDRIADFNAHALKLFGFTAAQMKEIRSADLSPPLQPDGRDSAERSRQLKRQALDNQPLEFEWLYRRKDGGSFLAEVRLVRFPSKDRDLVRASILNITERRRAEQLLRQREYEYQMLFESAGDAILIMEGGSNSGVQRKSRRNCSGLRARSCSDARTWICRRRFNRMAQARGKGQRKAGRRQCGSAAVV